MKLIFILLLISLVTGCSHITPANYHSLYIPADGFKVVQHTNSNQARKDNALYLPSRKIKNDEFKTDRLTNFIKELRMTMHSKRGVGIAANQVGKNLQIFLIEVNMDALWYEQLDVFPFQVFINPKITKASSERINFWHGCLSATGEKPGNVATYEWIEYEALNADGELHRGRLSGFAAVIFQHELRHLLGGTYLDKAGHFIDLKEFYSRLENNELLLFEQADKDAPMLLDDYVINETLDEYYTRNQ